MKSTELHIVETRCAICGEPLEYVAPVGDEPRSDTQRCPPCTVGELDRLDRLAQENG